MVENNEYAYKQRRKNEKSSFCHLNYIYAFEMNN